jgi:hypothetical protein
MIVKVSPTADWKLAEASRTLLPRLTVPLTLSCLYPAPGIVPFRSTTNELVEASVTLPLFKMPGMDAPGLTAPPVAEIVPTTPVPPRIPPVKDTLLFDWEPLTSRVPAVTVVAPV